MIKIKNVENFKTTEFIAFLRIKFKINKIKMIYLNKILHLKIFK
jgi:hypothetical protein